MSEELSRKRNGVFFFLLDVEVEDRERGVLEGSVGVEQARTGKGQSTPSLGNNKRRLVPARNFGPRIFRLSLPHWTDASSSWTASATCLPDLRDASPSLLMILYTAAEDML